MIRDYMWMKKELSMKGLVPISIGGTRFIRSKWYRDQSIIYLNESGEREWLDATHMDPRFYDNREDDMLLVQK